MRPAVLLRLAPAFGVAVLVAASLGCGAPASPPLHGTPAAAVRTPPRLDLGRIARQVHDRTNAERQGLGLPALAWRDDLARLAAVHSADMAARGFFAHENPDGQDVNARARGLAMECRQELGQVVYTGFSENLFKIGTFRGWQEETDENGTRRTNDYRAEDAFAPEIVEGWMHSPGHRENIVQPVSRAEGIALSLAEDGSLYVTQVFC